MGRGPDSMRPPAYPARPAPALHWGHLSGEASHLKRDGHPAPRLPVLFLHGRWCAGGRYLSARTCIHRRVFIVRVWEGGITYCSVTVFPGVAGLCYLFFNEVCAQLSTRPTSSLPLRTENSKERTNIKEMKMTSNFVLPYFFFLRNACLRKS